MYLHLELKRMATDRLQEAVERLHYLHELMSKTPGFIDAQIWEYLGNPAQYLVVRSWSEGAAHAAYRASDASKAFAASRPPHFIYENYAVEEWNCVAEATAHAAGEYLIREMETEDPGLWDWRIERQQFYNGIALEGGGVHSLRMYRMLPNDKADDRRVMTLQRWSSRAPYAKYLANFPTSEIRPNAQIEAYTLVDELTV